MDLGILMGIDASSVSPSDPYRKYGSDVCNTSSNQDDEHRRNKMTKISDDFSSSGGHISNSQQMLSSSSPNSLPYYHTSAYDRNSTSGYGHGIKSPFTTSQWIELEHQALIYKYITANAPVPSNLLIPIRKAIQSAAFSLRWGGFHLGFSNTDPEPGRCRRTDGKKWRCSREAVTDQKYCERHINRGRHCSRKPVEPQKGLNNLQPLTSTCTNNEFGLVSSNSLLNPVQIRCQETKSDNHPLRQFMDEWPDNHLSIDRTNLSISIPMPSSPTNTNLIPPSPLRLSLENIDIQTNRNRHENWVGGPLGEVLNNGSNNNSNASSPTGVLQKSTFRYFSSSSSGSSPQYIPFTQN